MMFDKIIQPNGNRYVPNDSSIGCEPRRSEGHYFKSLFSLFLCGHVKKKMGANIEIYLIIQLNIIWTCHENYRYSMSKKKKL
jgi:hypothetical protein